MFSERHIGRSLQGENFILQNNLEELAKRKKLRLNYYDYSQNGFYFVTLCTYKRQILFEMSAFDDDMVIIPSEYVANKMIEKWIKEVEKKFDITVDEHIIMPDHLHFIIKIEKEETERHTGRSLQDIMQWFCTMTTNEYIRNVKMGISEPFEKHIWQKSYFEHIIRNHDDYLETKRYILNNPTKYN